MSTTAQAPDPASAAHRIADALRDRILEGEVRPGSALREAVLAAEFEISRNTLRESLHLLAGEGLLDQVPNRGATVRVLGLADVRDIYRARRAIEVAAVTESAHAGEDAFAEFDGLVASSERLEQQGAWRQAATASLRFHQALVTLLGSSRLDEFFCTLLAQLRLAWAESLDEEEFQRSWADRDRELFNLLREGRRTQTVGSLLLYLDDSEKLALDVLRRARATGAPVHAIRQGARPNRRRGN